jgi:MFS family permease
MLTLAAGLVVFVAGFVIMVLEIIGARYLAKDFGGAFYVWVSQIGVVLVALALGYGLGGVWADRCQRAAVLAGPLLIGAAVTFFIPDFTPPLIEALVQRHPLDQPIPQVWQKLDPALGSALVFFLPCLVLATLSPYMIRLLAQRVSHVGKISGWIYAGGTLGGIAGVFLSGYVLIDHLAVSSIFRAMGVLTAGLAGLSLWLDRWLTGHTRGPTFRTEPPYE